MWLPHASQAAPLEMLLPLTRSLASTVQAMAFQLHPQLSLRIPGLQFSPAVWTTVGLSSCIHDTHGGSIGIGLSGDGALKLSPEKKGE